LLNVLTKKCFSSFEWEDFLSFSTTTNSICYPLGKFSSQVIKECSLSNYEFQYSSLAGSYYDNPFENVYRRNLVQFANTKELKLVLKDANSIFNKLYFAKHFSR